MKLLRAQALAALMGRSDGPLWIRLEDGMGHSPSTGSAPAAHARTRISSGESGIGGNASASRSKMVDADYCCARLARRGDRCIRSARHRGRGKRQTAARRAGEDHSASDNRCRETHPRSRRSTRDRRPIARRTRYDSSRRRCEQSEGFDGRRGTRRRASAGAAQSAGQRREARGRRRRVWWWRRSPAPGSLRWPSIRSLRSARFLLPRPQR